MPQNYKIYKNKKEQCAVFEVLTALVMNVTIFRDIAPCGPYANRRFGGRYHLPLQD
jgi:hypothetical protein